MFYLFIHILCDIYKKTSTFSYYRWTDVNFKELKDVILFAGFRKLALKYATFGMKEIMRSAIMSLQVKEVQKYIQDLTTKDCERGPAGVRAQAMKKDGKYVTYYVFMNPLLIRRVL